MSIKVAQTLRKNAAARVETMKKRLATRLGNKKGKLLKSSILPNTFGYCLAGSERLPPNDGPMTEPIDQTRGMMEKALGCNSF
jgi:hypothetical protein